jgi:hypothetical protein
MLPAITQSVRDASTQIKKVIKTSRYFSQTALVTTATQQQHHQNPLVPTQPS